MAKFAVTITETLIDEAILDADIAAEPYDEWNYMFCDEWKEE